jgi:hypothetical protein
MRPSGLRWGVTCGNNRDRSGAPRATTNRQTARAIHLRPLGGNRLSRSHTLRWRLEMYGITVTSGISLERATPRCNRGDTTYGSRRLVEPCGGRRSSVRLAKTDLLSLLPLLLPHFPRLHSFAALLFPPSSSPLPVSSPSSPSCHRPVRPTRPLWLCSLSTTTTHL